MESVGCRGIVSRGTPIHFLPVLLEVLHDCRQLGPGAIVFFRVVGPVLGMALPIFLAVLLEGSKHTAGVGVFFGVLGAIFGLTSLVLLEVDPECLSFGNLGSVLG